MPMVPRSGRSFPLLALTFNRLTSGMPLAIPPIEDDTRPPIAYAADPELVRQLQNGRMWS